MKDRILYEDNHLLVVNKLVGEIVQGDKTGDVPLSEELSKYIADRDKKPGGRAFIGVPHRLDRPVSGLVVMAKTSKGLSRMSEAFRDGAVSKKYWALVIDEPKEREGLLEDYLVRNEKQNKSFIVHNPQTPGAKYARLKYRYIGKSQRYYLVEVELLTGRHHQIRCQLAAHLSPIKGDLKYGAPRSNPDGGICLQSHSLSFVHPVKKEMVEVVAPYVGSWPKVEML